MKWKKIDDCTYDYLIIRVTCNTFKFCGKHEESTPYTFITENNVELAFKSDTTVNGKGFNITWTGSNNESLCYSENQGNIISPNYPDEYPANSDFYMDLHLRCGMKFELTINEFELEEQTYSNCPYDFLQIGSCRKAEGTKFCTYSTLDSYVHTGNTMSLAFMSDSSVQAKGYNISWNAIETEESNQNVNTCTRCFD